MRCHQCGLENPRQSKFCRKCGTFLGVHLKCPQCGSENPEDSSFCIVCGARLSGVQRSVKGGEEMQDDPENTETSSCPTCGEGNEKESRFCIHCGNSIPEKRVLFKRRYTLLGLISLILVGAIGFFLLGGSQFKLVGKVNGEKITRKEYLMRLDRTKKIYESRYGQGLFEGEAGKENLNRLKTDILDEMVVEKILIQGAKKAGYTSAPEEEIEKQLEAIKKRFTLSDADFKKKMGGSIEDLKEELRNGWMISQFVEKTILKDSQGDPNLLFGEWFTKAKANSKIETYEKSEPVLATKASCCQSGCGGGRVQPLDPKIEKEAKAKALEYYERKTQKKGANARVTNFGCHIQVDIIEEGKVVVSLTYNQGEVQEI